MTEPLVCAVMLTRDRAAMAARAVRCFRRQTYDPVSRFLLIADSGDPTWYDPASDSENEIYVQIPSHGGIGALRNRANDMVPARRNPILIHWDSDDISHPNRIAEQVALLQSSGKECVGYREMLFWRNPPIIETADAGPIFGVACVTKHRGEAWLYHNADSRYCLGTSLCYWRSAWEKRPFPELAGTGRGEDKEWLRGVDSLGVGFLHERGNYMETLDTQPRMIATIHAGNAKHYDAALKPDQANWTRVPEWDYYVQKTMEAA